MANDLDYTGKMVLVVGGSSGIGNGIAQAFRARGAKVTVWGTRASAADYKGEPGSDLEGLAYTQVDVAQSDAVAKAEFAGDGLDVLVQCQGTVLYKRGEYEIGGFEKVLNVNLTSMMSCAIRFQPLLARNRGAMILISSTAAYQTTLGNPAYNASKAGILGLTRALARAWIKSGVRVNGIAPGLVETKLTKITIEDPKRLEWSLNLIPRGRVGQPEDIAGAALYLASPMADFVVGQTLCVDGGVTI
jgi:3-oxoacyl-[acyl-carrier protein] reductase